jgi:hypothetical protein
MASFKRYTGTLGDASWPSGYTSIYTVPTGKESVITGMTVCNTSAYELPVSIRVIAGDSEWDKVSVLAPLQSMTQGTFSYYESISYDPAAPVVGASNNLTTLDNTRKKFGSASARFDGSAHLSLADDPSLELDGDFTIEYWFYTDAHPSTTVMPLSKTTGSSALAGSWSFGLVVSGNLKFYNHGTGDPQQPTEIGVLGAIAPTTWHHVALTRSGTTLRGFIDGVLGFTVANTINWTNAGDLMVGTESGVAGQNITGNIQDLRITKGLARYTESFSRPTKSYAIGEKGRSFLNDVHVPAGQSIKVLTAEKVVLEGDDTVQGTAPLIGGTGADTFDVWLSIYEDV